MFETRSTDISDFMACPHLWAERVLNGKEKPLTKALSEGIACHQLMEDYGNGKALPSYAMASPLERAAIKLAESQDWMPQTEGVLFELGGERFQLQLDEDIVLGGQLDHLDIRDPKNIVITDFKFRSNGKFAVSEDELAYDNQALLYSYWTFSKYDPDTVTFRHANVVKGKVPEVMPLRQVVYTKGSPMLAYGMQNLFIIIRQMYETWKGQREAKRNKKSCYRYGPCYLLKSCNAGVEYVQLRSKAKKGFTIYVECRPRNAPYEVFEDLMKDLIFMPDGTPWDAEFLPGTQYEREQALKEKVAQRVAEGALSGLNVITLGSNAWSVCGGMLTGMADEVVS